MIEFLKIIMNANKMEKDNIAVPDRKIVAHGVRTSEKE